MSQVSYRVREYLWVTVPNDLEIFCNQLGHKLKLPFFEFDEENVFEWGIIKIENGYIEANISRKHKSGMSLFSEPIHILFLVEANAPTIYDSDWVTQNLVPVYGQAIANLTKQPTYYGKIEYLSSNAYAYYPSHQFDSQL